MPGAANSAAAGGGYVMMSNPAAAGGNVFMSSALQAQSMLMPRSGLAGTGMVMPGAAGGNSYFLAGGGVPQYMMGYPAISTAGYQFSGATADYSSAYTTAYSSGNPYALQMPSGTTAMYGQC